MWGPTFFPKKGFCIYIYIHITYIYIYIYFDRDLVPGDDKPDHSAVPIEWRPRSCLVRTMVAEN